MGRADNLLNSSTAANGITIAGFDLMILLYVTTLCASVSRVQCWFPCNLACGTTKSNTGHAHDHHNINAQK